MTNPIPATAGCQMVAEYVDEAECPANRGIAKGEVVRPQVVEDYLDLWSRDDGFREFTV
jgi:hypothetical protein